MSPSRDMTVRAATASDRTRVTGALGCLPRLYPGGGAWLDRRFDDALLGRSRLAVAAGDGRLLGLTLDTPKGEHRRKLSTLFVHPQFRHKGVGTWLLFLTFEHWLREGVRDAWITVPEHDRATTTFLEGHGFRPLPTLRDRYGPGRSEVVSVWDPDFADDVVTHGGAAALLRNDPERPQAR